ncbi:lysophospholipase [Nocardia sp. NBC_01499]|uniref:alpha/beta hydrolase n=1 Tax=Nocardia sp. NBC_01499 TaxID=2903597 RepID=UPI0038679E4A
MKYNRRAAVVVAAAGIASFAAPVVAAGADPVPCQEITVPVVLGESPGWIAGTLCMPAGEATTRIQVLVPGLTYNRTYFDFPDPEYSYVQYMAQHGEATLAIDRLGTGQSWHPPSGRVTFAAHVSTVQQVIQAIRAGTIAPNVTSVVLVGHSYGSAVASAVASTPGLVDALIVTSTGHSWLANIALAASPVTMWPAAMERRFRGQGLDPGYLTTWPGLTVVIVPDSGHVLNLDRSRMIGWTAALTFLN